MTQRQVLQAISGLIAAFFVVMLSSTVVATSLPVIVSDLGGSQADYTWVITANFLTMAVTTPIWGKLGDRMHRKTLIIIALIAFSAATAVGGFATDTTWLIVCRLIQGAGVGGMVALGQVAIADVVSPRERGRYMGLMGAVMGIAQLGGPMLGGVVTDLIGWRWNFFLPVPIAIGACLLIALTLRSPRLTPTGRFDYLGSLLVVAGFGLLLVWLSLAGSAFTWDSATSIGLGIVSGVLVIAAIVWELAIKEPIVPLRLFGQRTFALATIASLAVGVTMYGAAIFVSQYLQLARGLTPTESGVTQMPLFLGSLLASVAIGQLMTRTGRWKPYLIGSAVILVAGLILMGTLHYDTSVWLVGVYLALIGIGTGGLMQNLVLVMQNQLRVTELGAGTGAHTFVRSIGSTAGVTVLGAILTASVSSRLADGLPALGSTVLGSAACAPGLEVLRSGALPNVRELCAPVQHVVESTYGDSIAAVFWWIVPLAIMTLIAVLLLPNLPLSKKNSIQQLEEELGAQFSALEPVDDPISDELTSSDEMTPSGSDEAARRVRQNGRRDDG